MSKDIRWTIFACNGFATDNSGNQTAKGGVNVFLYAATEEEALALARKTIRRSDYLVAHVNVGSDDPQIQAQQMVLDELRKLNGSATTDDYEGLI